MTFSIGLYPMHGTGKMWREGMRTRDAHLLEHLVRSPGVDRVAVYPRPEPLVMAPRRRLRRAQFAARWEVDVQSRYLLRLPSPTRARWWVTSASEYPVHEGDAVIAWHPLCAGALSLARGTVVLDLLDNWLVHDAYKPIMRELESAYTEAFDRADLVFANSEGTAALARAYGRHDVRILPNGVDPERFEGARKKYRGPWSAQFDDPNLPIVGYGGKIGSRLDFSLIAECVDSIDANFLFLGPVLGERKEVESLHRRPNVIFVGDVPYDRYQYALGEFDIGWVPHAVGRAEVGGDAIKIYEYRAAHLPVMSTPIIGASRLQDSAVKVAIGDEFVSELASQVRMGPTRVAGMLAPEHTWKRKVETILGAIKAC